MTDAIGNALNGINNAFNRANTAAQAISSGEGVDVKEIVTLAQAAQGLKANAKVIEAVRDSEKRLLDILA